MAIRTVFSDLGNVVVGFEPQKTDAALAGLTGVDLAVVEDVLRRKCGTLLRRFSRGALSRYEFRRTLCARLGAADLPDEYDFLHAWNAAVTALNEPVLERWRLLRHARVSLAAVTNVDPMRLEALQRKRGLLSTFGEVLTSCNEGLLKPSGEFMVRALDRTGSNAAETLFVDDLEENLAPARKLGIHVHCYRSLESLDACLVEHGLASFPT